MTGRISETAYVLISNLTKLRAAERLLRDVLPTGAEMTNAIRETVTSVGQMSAAIEAVIDEARKS